MIQNEMSAFNLNGWTRRDRGRISENRHFRSCSYGAELAPSPVDAHIELETGPNGYGRRWHSP